MRGAHLAVMRGAHLAVMRGAHPIRAIRRALRRRNLRRRPAWLPGCASFAGAD
jgi:hypothetical protein